MDKIAVAKNNGEEWIETTPDIIKHYNRSGLGGAKYFIYSGIKVCEKGKLEEILKEHEMELGKKLYGAEEGTLKGSNRMDNRSIPA